MNEKLPRITAHEVIRVLEKAGFFLTRQSGSHKIYKNKTGKRVTVPYHTGKVLMKVDIVPVDTVREEIKEQVFKEAVYLSSGFPLSRE